jgi:hypothetical protein
MAMNIALNTETLKGLDDFLCIDSKENMLDTIDDIIESAVRFGLISEYGMGAQIGLLFDIKNLIKTLPERQFAA